MQPPNFLGLYCQKTFLYKHPLRAASGQEKSVDHFFTRSVNVITTQLGDFNKSLYLQLWTDYIHQIWLTGTLSYRKVHDTFFYRF